MRPPQFNFVPAYQVTPKTIEQSKRTVTINTKQSTLFFSITDPEAVVMIGKYVRFYIDVEKNVLAWKIFEKGEIADMKDIKQVEERSNKGRRTIIRAQIGTALRALKYPPNKSFKKLPLSPNKEVE